MAGDQTPLTGLTGAITLPNSFTQFVQSVTVRTGAALLDFSHFGGLGWRARVKGIKDLAGSLVIFVSKGTDGTNSTDPFALADGASGAMTITFDSGCSIQFDAIFGNIQIVGEYQGLVIMTADFAKSDDVAPTIAWATA